MDPHIIWWITYGNLGSSTRTWTSIEYAYLITHLQHIPKPTLALACTPNPGSTSTPLPPATTEPLNVTKYQVGTNHLIWLDISG